MAGIIYFGKNIDPVGYNSIVMRVFGEFIRTYIETTSTEITKKVYESYDLYNDSLDFSRLTFDEKIQCYTQIKKAIEEDLDNIDDFYNEFPKNIIHDAWHKEIKPKMKILIQL